MKTSLSILAATAVILGSGLLVPAAHAQTPPPATSAPAARTTARTAVVTAKRETLTLTLGGFAADGNQVTATIDGYAPFVIHFGSALKYTVIWDDLGGSDKTHTWRFVVKAADEKTDRVLVGKSVPTITHKARA